MLRLLFGTALLPTSAISLWVAAETLFSLASGARAAAPFIAGAAAAALARIFVDFESSFFGGLMRRVFVLGHELTHAAAAWGQGGKVYDMEVGKDGGHVDLSHSNAFISLAPYCLPIYTGAVILVYRIILWRVPDFQWRETYLFLLGLTFAFHLIFTFDSIWDVKQPDLDAAGGVVFSLSWISLSNALVALILLKSLFPRSVFLMESLARAGRLTAGFWKGAYSLFAALLREAKAMKT